MTLVHCVSSAKGSLFQSPVVITCSRITKQIGLDTAKALFAGSKLRVVERTSRAYWVVGITNAGSVKMQNFSVGHTHTRMWPLSLPISLLFSHFFLTSVIVPHISTTFLKWLFMSKKKKRKQNFISFRLISGGSWLRNRIVCLLWFLVDSRLTNRICLFLFSLTDHLTILRTFRHKVGFYLYKRLHKKNERNNCWGRLIFSSIYFSLFPENTSLVLLALKQIFSYNS